MKRFSCKSSNVLGKMAKLISPSLRSLQVFSWRCWGEGWWNSEFSHDHYLLRKQWATTPNTEEYWEQHVCPLLHKFKWTPERIQGSSVHWLVRNTFRPISIQSVVIIQWRPVFHSHLWGDCGGLVRWVLPFADVVTVCPFVRTVN